jgi:hypothetical protein
MGIYPNFYPKIVDFWVLKLSHAVLIIIIGENYA